MEDRERGQEPVGRRETQPGGEPLGGEHVALMGLGDELRAPGRPRRRDEDRRVARGDRDRRRRSSRRGGEQRRDLGERRHRVHGVAARRAAPRPQPDRGSPASVTPGRGTPRAPATVLRGFTGSAIAPRRRMPSHASTWAGVLWATSITMSPFATPCCDEPRSRRRRSRAARRRRSTDTSSDDEPLALPVLTCSVVDELGDRAQRFSARRDAGGCARDAPRSQRERAGR